MTDHAARALKRTHEKGGDTVDAREFDARETFPGLPFDVVVTHVLREKNLPDPADLATLRAVSRGMRDAVDITERQLKEMSNDEARNQQLLSALLRLHRRGLLAHKEYLCEAAASRGLFAELKLFHQLGFPWDKWTCGRAAFGRHFELLKWLRDKGCPWEAWTCRGAATSGNLEKLQ